MKNPNGGEEVIHRSPEEIMDEIAALDAESAEVLAKHPGNVMKAEWKIKTLSDVCEYINGKAHEQCINANGRFCCNQL